MLRAGNIEAFDYAGRPARLTESSVYSNLVLFSETIWTEKLTVMFADVALGDSFRQRAEKSCSLLFAVSWSLGLIRTASVLFFYFFFLFFFFYYWVCSVCPRCSHKESRLAFVKVQISLGNYHASNMRGGKKGDALPSGPL